MARLESLAGNSILQASKLISIALTGFVDDIKKKSLNWEIHSLGNQHIYCLLTNAIRPIVCNRCKLCGRFAIGFTPHRFYLPLESGSDKLKRLLSMGTRTESWVRSPSGEKQRQQAGVCLKIHGRWSMVHYSHGVARVGHIQTASFSSMSLGFSIQSLPQQAHLPNPALLCPTTRQLC